MKCKVFQQKDPIRSNVRDKEGDVQYFANLVLFGTVEGTEAECFQKAKVLTSAPVLERVPG